MTANANLLNVFIITESIAILDMIKGFLKPRLLAGVLIDKLIAVTEKMN